MARSTTSARERLLVAAGDLFYERGLTATGVDTVARRAGVSKPTLYAQFTSKVALVAAVLERRHARRMAELDAWLEPIADVRQRPLAVFAWLGDWYGRDGSRGCAFVNAAAELPERDDPARVVTRCEKRWLAELLEQLAQDAGARDPARLGSQLQLLIDGVAARVVVHGPQAAGDAVADATRAAQVLLSAAAPYGDAAQAGAGEDH